jgi:hypothetical protein
MASLQIDKIINWLWRPVEGRNPEKVYALVDAARSELIYPKILNSGVENACLHRGENARELAWVAPYLVALQRDEPFTKWLLENGWGNSWGIFVQSIASLNKLKQHFQTFLKVYDEEGNSFFFRFYDPRVMRVYLPTCNSDEIEKVFGPLGSYLLENDDGSVLLRYFSVSQKIHIEKTTLS